MYLAELNGVDYVKLCLESATGLSEDERNRLYRLIEAGRPIPAGRPSGSSVLQRISLGALARARAYLSGIPKEVLSDPAIKKLIDSADKYNGSLLDAGAASWWEFLATNCAGRITKSITPQYKPNISVKHLAGLIRKESDQEAQDWIRKQQMVTNQNQGQANAQQGMPANGTYARPGQPLRDLANQLRAASKRLSGVGGLKKEDFDLLLLSLGGELTEAGIVDRVKGVAGKAVDLLNPQRQNTLASKFLNRSQNKVIATIAIRKGLELVAKYKPVIIKKLQQFIHDKEQATQGTAPNTGNAGGAPTNP